MSPAALQAPPLRGNGRRVECFLRPRRSRDRCPAELAIHRKSDGVLVARGTLHRAGRILRFRIDHASRDVALAAIHAELGALLAHRHPRHRLEVVMAATRRGGSGHRDTPPRRAAQCRSMPDPAARRLAAVRAEVPADYGAARGLSPQREPRWLSLAGVDHAGRECWLVPEAMRAWRRLDAAARADGVTLVLVSGFRSADYQARILAAKRARGLAMADILEVNAAPGYSEHHSGRAVDLTTPGCPPAEAAFESTEAFRWLARRAGAFGFRMSYPRGNPHGIVPEPWHWYFVGFGSATPRRGAP